MSMQNILIVFFIVYFLIIILFFPFKIRCMGHFNIIEMMGFYSLKILKLKIINGRIKYENGKIVVQNSVNIIQDKFNGEFSRKFIYNLLSKIEVKKVEIFFSGGISDNSFSSAIICGGVSSFVQSVYSYFSQKYYNVKLYEDIEPKFGEDNLELTFDFVINVSMFSIIVSLLSAFKKNFGEIKNEK